jgi:parallel beta-helix repeat protein
MDTRFRLVRTAFLLAAPLCLLGAWPGYASASHVSCGDTITQNTTLDSDLVDCPGDGVIIGADNISLDLNAHTVDGSPFAFGEGVNNRSGFDGIEITNGTIQQFEHGVRLTDSASNTIRDVVAGPNKQIGLLFEASDDNVIERNVIYGNGFGIRLDTLDYFSTRGSSGNRIEDNSLYQNGGGGISMFRASNTIVRGNKLAGNAVGNSAAIGVLSNTNTLIEKNRIIDNPIFGLELDNSRGTVVAHNVIDRNFGGILIEEAARENTVTQNFVRDNRSFGIQISFTGPNLIERNFVSHNGSAGTFIASGIYISGTGNQILDNAVDDNNRDGLLLRDAHNTRVERNKAYRNADDGIDSQGVNTFLANTANRNGDYGIEATPAAVDGGGNKANGNGNPAQCLNVTCK